MLIVFSFMFMFMFMNIKPLSQSGPDQIGLVAADNRTRANHRFKFRAVGASSSGLRSSFAARTVGDWNQLPAVVVEQESRAAFKNQLDRLAPVACRMP